MQHHELRKAAILRMVSRDKKNPKQPFWKQAIYAVWIYGYFSPLICCHLVVWNTLIKADICVYELCQNGPNIGRIIFRQLHFWGGTH